MQARVVTGPPALALEVSRTLKDLVARGADPGLVASSVADRRLEDSEERGAPREWDMRRRQGGLDNLDTMVRILQLRFAPDHLDVLTPTVAGALAKFANAGLLEDALVRDLLGAHHLLRQTENVLAIAVDDRLDVDGAPRELKAVLSRAAGLESLSQLETALQDVLELVQTTFQELVGDHCGTAH